MTNLRTMLRFAALGKGNGALFQLFHLFQLVPLRWPLNAAVAGSMIGKFGVPGGGLVPNAMAFVQVMCGHQGIKVSRYQGMGRRVACRAGGACAVQDAPQADSLDADVGQTRRSRTVCDKLTPFRPTAC